MSLSDRFAVTPPGHPLSLQLLYPEPLELDADAITTVLHDYHADLTAATVELAAVSGNVASQVSSNEGPPAKFLGLIRWSNHVVKFAAFDGPMPYGPLETCVNPAMMAPELKEEARRHASHLLLYYSGTEVDPLECYVALGAVAGALARFGASVVMNEEARTAAPAFDLIPDPEENAMYTLRNLPIPYLWGGFVKLDVGDAERPWARTFACHRLALPDLAYRLRDHDEAGHAFRLFAGLLGYLRQSGENFRPGDTLDLGEDVKLRLRAPTAEEWYLESEGAMLVVEKHEG